MFLFRLLSFLCSLKVGLKIKMVISYHREKEMEDRKRRERVRRILNIIIYYLEY